MSRWTLDPLDKFTRIGEPIPVAHNQSGYMGWVAFDNQINPNMAVDGLVVVRHPGGEYAKEDFAQTAYIYAAQQFSDITGIHKRPVIVVGYSTGADAALFLAHDYGELLNITDVVLLGPTFSGGHRPYPATPTNSWLNENSQAILTTILARGANIYFADDTHNDKSVADSLNENDNPAQFDGEFHYIDLVDNRNRPTDPDYFGLVEHYDEEGKEMA